MMRKRLAMLLAFVMLLTTVQGITFAAEPNAFSFFVTNEQGLIQDATSGFKLDEDNVSAENESALIKWSIMRSGEYTLEYWIEDFSGKTRRIELKFENVDNQVRYYINSYTNSAGVASTTPDTNTMVAKIFNTSTGWKAATASETSTILGSKFYLNATDGTAENMKYITIPDIAVGTATNPLDLRFYVSNTGDDAGMMYVYSNGITKGHIVDFKLSYEGSTAGEAKIFNGISKVEITPTHLRNNGGTIEDVDPIDYTVATVADGELPGSRPGIKVAVDVIKRVKDGVFKPIDDTTPMDIILKLTSNNEVTNDYYVYFSPYESSAIKINTSPTEHHGCIKLRDDKLYMYFSKDNTDLPNVLKWDKLDKSKIITASYTVNLDGASNYKVKDNGYTYLGCRIDRVNASQVRFTIDPYYTSEEAVYSIYGSGAENFEPGDDTLLASRGVAGKSESISIVADVGNDQVKYFKILVKISGQTFRSQTIKYNTDGFTTAPESTRITSVDNLFVIPNGNDNTSGAKTAGFDIAFKVPEDIKQILANNASLYYELYVDKKEIVLNDHYEFPLSTKQNSSGPHMSKLIKLSLDGDNVKIDVLGTTGQGTYDERNDMIYIQGVTLLNYGESKWEQIVLGNTNAWDYLTNHVMAEDSLMNMDIPGNYYIALRPVLVIPTPLPTDPDNVSVSTGNVSISESVALDYSKIVVPVPTNITAIDRTNEDKTVIAEKITYGLVDIQEYVNKMLEPAHLYLRPDINSEAKKYSGSYEIYFFQKDTKLTSTMQSVKDGTIIPQSKTTGSAIHLSEADLETLRKGDVLVYDISYDALVGGDTSSITFSGLDDNTSYYVAMRVKLTPKDEDGNVVVIYSELSKQCTFTTPTIPKKPEPSDKVPPAPEKIWVDNPKSQDNPTLVEAPTAVIGWAPVKVSLEEDSSISKVYYEFIRMNEQFTSLSEQGKTIEELVAANSTRVGFRSDAPDANSPYMSIYKGSTWEKISPEQQSRDFKLTDNTLETNKIYYYYVRTVCVIDGQAVRSSWIMVPVTTTTVVPPINLKVETEEYSYNEKEEIVISFDAAIPQGGLEKGDYDFDIAIKCDDDADYSTNNFKKTLIKSTADHVGTPQGYTHFVYKLSDLKPSKKYYIKVRVVDKTSSTDGEYAKSLYVGPVTARTDYDEKDDENQKKYAESLTKFDQEVEKLRRKVYWTVEEEEVYKYRTSYTTADIAGQKQYDLVVEDKNSATYYLPAAVFKKVNEENVTLNITIDKYSASIRPYTITEKTAEIADAIDDIDNREISDYYVQVSFKLLANATTINGEAAITPRMEIEMSVVKLGKTDENIESDIERELENLITKERKDFISELDKKIKKDKIADDVLSELVEEAVSSVEKDHAKKVKRIIEKAEKKTRSISTIDKAVLLTAYVEAFAGDGYYYSSGWISVEVYSAGESFYIEAIRLGSYIITGQKSLIDSVPTLAPYQSFISKYGLTDFFTLDTYMIKTAVTKEQLYGAVARVMGAPRNTDYVVFLQNNKLNSVNKIGISKNIRQDEAIYIIMQAYEKTHHRKVSTIKIKNKQSVTNIGAFQPVYRDYVYAAVELKIIDNPSSKVIPSKQMTVEEIIKILYKMQTS